MADPVTKPFKYYASAAEYEKDVTDKVLDGAFTAANPDKSMSGTSFPTTADKKLTADLFDNAFKWEPKYQHKFIMTLGDIPAYLIKSSAKPSAENGEIVLDHINIQRKVKGKTKWNNIEITLYDPITPSGAQAVMQWFRSHHESATGRDGYSSYYKKDLTLEQLDGMGRTVEEWTIKGAFIQSCNWGTLDWSAEEVQTITATLAYDYAFLQY
jgi:hypothetical protein